MRGILLRIFKSKFFQITLSVFLFASGFWLYTSTFHENFFSNVVNMTVVPIQETFFELSKNIDDMVSDFKVHKEMEEENRALKKEIRRLRELTVDYSDLKRKNDEYQRYLEFKKDHTDLKFLSASVIARDTSELFYGFIINIGTESGISEGDSVVTENGFVGYVCKVGPKASKVKTILSPDIKLGATDSSSRDTGIISGNIELCQQGLTAMTLIPSPNTIKTEDIVITTGLSGLCPKNLLIGKIKELNYDNINLTNYAVIEPFEDIKKVRSVLVITGFDGKGQIAQEAIGQSS